VRTRLSSSWKGRGTQEGAGKREQVTLREGTVLFRGGKGKLMEEQLERRGATDYDRRLDLGLQSAPRSTNIQGNRRKMKHMMVSRNV